MPKPESPVVLRLPSELVSRAEFLRPMIEKDPELRAWGRVSRSAVLRLAILKGLEALETQYRHNA